MALNVKLSVVPADNLFDFFRERVDDAARARGAPVSQDTVFYLSNLLAALGHRDEEEPATLVELRVRATHAEFAEALTCWRRLGDHALVQLGFFREHLRMRRISTQYYADMGRGAYGTAARMLRDPEGGLGEVFGEMSARFEDCTQVIAEVRDEAREQNATDTLRLYEEWLATGSPRVADKLRQLGVVPARFGGTA